MPGIHLFSQSPGSHLVNVTEFDSEQYLVMVTKCGIVKRTPLSEFESPSKRGIIALKLDGDDGLLVTIKNKNVIRILVRDIRIQGRNTQGVRIMRLDKGGPGRSLLRESGSCDRAML